MKKLYALVVGIIVSFQAYSASVTPATSRVCTQSYTTISNIVISETGAVGDFGTGTATTARRRQIT